MNSKLSFGLLAAFLLVFNFISFAQDNDQNRPYWLPYADQPDPLEHTLSLVLTGGTYGWGSYEVPYNGRIPLRGAVGGFGLAYKLDQVLSLSAHYYMFEVTDGDWNPYLLQYNTEPFLLLELEVDPVQILHLSHGKLLWVRHHVGENMVGHLRLPLTYQTTYSLDNKTPNYINIYIPPMGGNLAYSGFEQQFNRTTNVGARVAYLIRVYDFIEVEPSYGIAWYGLGDNSQLFGEAKIKIGMIISKIWTDL